MTTIVYRFMNKSMSRFSRRIETFHLVKKWSLAQVQWAERI